MVLWKKLQAEDGILCHFAFLSSVHLSDETKRSLKLLFFNNDGEMIKIVSAQPRTGWVSDWFFAAAELETFPRVNDQLAVVLTNANLGDIDDGRIRTMSDLDTLSKARGFGDRVMKIRFR